MKKTLQLGEEKPYEPPQWDEKPRFAMSARSSGPAGLRLRPVSPSLDVRTPWEPLLPLLGHTVLTNYLIAVLLFPIS